MTSAAYQPLGFQPIYLKYNGLNIEEEWVDE
jgi:hypothetical protein